jgi:acetyl-CoA C-acetyltransferase
LVIKEAVNRAGIPDLTQIDEVLMGNVVQAGVGQAPARQAAIYGGLPDSICAATINKVCGSGLKTVMLAAQAIRAGDGQLFVTGGMENMSRAPYLVDARLGTLRYGHSQLTDALLNDGLWDPFENWGMGEAAEFIAEKYQVTRQDMDEYALHSHQKAISAMDSGKFREQIIPVELVGKKGETTTFSNDESPKRDTTYEALAKLKPAFLKDGKITAGNSPGLNDGAAALVVSSRARAESWHIRPLARIVGYDQAALAPKYLFDAPIKVVPQLLRKLNWTLDQVNLIELNEAFAAQVLANGYALADLGWNWEKVNVNGGSIALGHPIGASGARIVTTLLYAMRDANAQRGIAAMCLGGAEAVAIALELEI